MFGVKSKRGPQDRTRIDINDPLEVRYWCIKLGCTESELCAAVRKVGVMLTDVKDEIRDRAT